MISIHDLSGIERLAARCKLDRERLRRLRIAFHKKHRGAKAALDELPDPAREVFAREVEFHALKLDSRHDSRRDGATKLVFRTGTRVKTGDSPIFLPDHPADGARRKIGTVPDRFETSPTHDGLIEAVILRLASGRTALCVSTQQGCAADCDFCATGKMGLARNLSAAEILDQLVQANELLASENRGVRNVVFMGMGEPLHNEEQLFAAMDVLVASAAFDMHPRRLMISTVGIPAAMVRLAKRYPESRLALSLHSARQDVRQAIMPIARRHGLAELREALDEVVAIQRHEVMIEYLLLADVNDSAEDAQALATYLGHLSVHINLIPYNPIEGAPHLSGSDATRRAEFSVALKRAGFQVTTRYSLGADIAAACGQLVRERQDRKRVPGLLPL